jgi:DNA-binding MarR family transcriptional regulator
VIHSGNDAGGAASAGLAPGQDAGPAAVLTLLRLVRSLERVSAGLTPQQYRILKLADAGEERSARLAERLAVAKPTLTASVDGLVAAGFVERKQQPGDRRVVRLCLTAAGRDAMNRAEAAYAAWLDDVLNHTGDPAAMISALQTLDAAMDERRRARLAAGQGRA